MQFVEESFFKKHISDCDVSNLIYHALGGRHKNFTPTRCYIKAVVLRKSGSDTDDVKKGLKKKIYKELGVKLDDISFHLQPTSTSTSGQATSSALLSNVNRATSHPVPGISALDKP